MPTRKFSVAIVEAIISVEGDANKQASEKLNSELTKESKSRSDIASSMATTSSV